MKIIKSKVGYMFFQVLFTLGLPLMAALVFFPSPTLFAQSADNVFDVGGVMCFTKPSDTSSAFAGGWKDPVKAKTRGYEYVLMKHKGLSSENNSISVGIVTYKDSKSLAKCIDEIETQTIPIYKDTRVTNKSVVSMKTAGGLDYREICFECTKDNTKFIQKSYILDLGKGNKACVSYTRLPSNPKQYPSADQLDADVEAVVNSIRCYK